MASFLRPAAISSRAAFSTPASAWGAAAGVIPNFASSSRLRLDSPSSVRRSYATAPGTVFTTTQTQEAEPAPTGASEAGSSEPSSIPDPNPLPGSAPGSAGPSATHTPMFSLGGADPNVSPDSPYFSTRWAPEDKHPNNQDPRVPTHTLHVYSTRNNVHLNFTDRLGPLFANITGGTGKMFKSGQRQSYEAATQASTKIFNKIVDWARTRGRGSAERPKIRVAYRGQFGTGRDAVTAALAGAEGQELRTLIVRVEDRSKVKIGGTRAKKPRRL
ncbi:hypothetical protein IAT38_006769 [Cryptococcus sp. DSM 104549]